MMTIQPDPAEEAMLRNIICDLIADAKRQDQISCRFRRFRVLISNLRNRYHLTVVAGREPVIDADINE